MDNENLPLNPPQKIAHIGIAVKNIQDAISFYTDSLGLHIEKVEEVPSEGVKIAFIKIGSTRIELLEPLHETSPIHTFIEKRGEGIHHIALDVDHIEVRLKEMKTNGIRLINEQVKKGAGGAKIAFLHPKSTNGVLYELCEHEEENVTDGHV